MDSINTDVGEFVVIEEGLPVPPELLVCVAKAADIEGLRNMRAISAGARDVADYELGCRIGIVA